MDPIKFPANVSRIATSLGGGYKITLELPESETLQTAKLLALYLKNVSVEITPLPEE